VTVALIATQQPMASDLRAIPAVLDIAKINLMMGEEPLVKPLVDVPRMAEKARDMLHRAGQLSAVGGA
jgi:phosphate transport system protein